MIIHHSNNVNEIKRLTDDGYEPVECSIDGASVVGPLTMDHHGEFGHLEGVAVRAYRDHFGARAEDPRFVTTGAPDADQSFAIAALAGMLPHPSRAAEFGEKTPQWLVAAMTADLTRLSKVVNQQDIDPIPGLVELPTFKEGRQLLLFQQLSAGKEDAVAAYAAVNSWRLLTGPRCPEALLEAVAAGEEARIADARDKLDNVLSLNDCVTVVSSKVWGFDVWYHDYSPVIVALNPHTNAITVGAKSAAVAEELFGPGGLKKVYATEDFEGWGGHPWVGGSTRGRKYDWGETLAYASKISDLIR